MGSGEELATSVQEVLEPVEVLGQELHFLLKLDQELIYKGMNSSREKK